MAETYSLRRAEAYARMIGGHARFRVVIVTGKTQVASTRLEVLGCLSGGADS